MSLMAMDVLLQSISKIDQSLATRWPLLKKNLLPQFPELSFFVWSFFSAALCKPVDIKCFLPLFSQLVIIFSYFRLTSLIPPLLCVGTKTIGVGR